MEKQENLDFFSVWNAQCSCQIEENVSSRLFLSTAYSQAGPHFHPQLLSLQKIFDPCPFSSFKKSQGDSINPLLPDTSPTLCLIQVVLLTHSTTQCYKNPFLLEMLTQLSALAGRALLPMLKEMQQN